MTRYIFSPEAKEDLREIRNYLVKQGGQRLARHVLRSKPRRILDLVEPVEAHFLDYAVGDHDQPRL